MKTIRITELGMLLTISLVLSYLESMLPVIVAVPGVKIGLANIITMLILYNKRFGTVFLFVTVRVVLAGILFSGVPGIIYGFAGSLFCIGIMSILKRFPFFSVMGVSMTGAIFHNAGQIFVAVFMIENTNVLYYLPFLCISGTVSGLLVGYIAYILIKKYNRMIFRD